MGHSTIKIRKVAEDELNRNSSNETKLIMNLKLKKSLQYTDYIGTKISEESVKLVDKYGLED